MNITLSENELKSFIELSAANDKIKKINLEEGYIHFELKDNLVPFDFLNIFKATGKLKVYEIKNGNLYLQISGTGKLIDIIVKLVGAVKFKYDIIKVLPNNIIEVAVARKPMSIAGKNTHIIINMVDLHRDSISVDLTLQ